MLCRLFSFYLILTFSFPEDTSCQDSSNYINKIKQTLIDFSISDSIHEHIYYESCNLVIIAKEIYDNRDLKLDSLAAEAFFRMKKDAKKDSIEFSIISAYRSFNHQKGIINRKLEKGQSIANIMKENTLPGYSEHHTGCAIDFISEGASSLSTDFEKTKTFIWLSENANNYGFYLSYPKENNKGIIYEPWHWMFKKND